MGTKNFNILDKFIAWMRLGQIIPHIEKGDILLDFGCGHQAYLLNHVKGRIARGVGLDYDTDSDSISKNVVKRKFKFKEKLPFKNEQFTKITLLAVIEHIELDSIGPLFKEFNRVLKKSGKIVITTPTPGIGKFILELLAFKLGIISKEEVGDHKKYYSKADIFEIAKKHGFNMHSYKTFQFGGNSICVLGK